MGASVFNRDSPHRDGCVTVWKFSAHLFDAIARDVVPSAERAMRARIVGRGGGHGIERRARATISAGDWRVLKYLFRRN